MKMTIDGNDIFHGERAIRRYVVNLVRCLSQINHTHRIDVLAFEFRKNLRADFNLSHPASEVRFKKIRFPGSVFEKCWNTCNFPPLSWLTGQVDLFHAVGPFVPPSDCFPIMNTLHGMHHTEVPQYFDHRFLSRYARFMERSVKRSSYFITVSETMKKEFVDFYGVSPDAVRAIPLGVSSEFVLRDVKAAKEIIRQRFGVKSPYLLYVGGIQTHKNVLGTLEAFSIFKKRSQTGHVLILGGDPRTGEHLLKQIPKLGLQMEDVFVTGYLSQESDDLPWLYAGADIFLFPTFYEGWSSPPLEAMASGIPVIASDIPAHQENLGEAAYLVSPDDPYRIAEAIFTLWEDKNLADRYRKAGINRAGLFTWQGMTERTLKYYEEIGLKHGCTRVKQ